jgi:uncharacterized iron-regulated membrane protein
MTDTRLYRTIWRWHFYAGLIVAPFLLILSVTGAIYLFNDEINDLTMPDLMFVAPAKQQLPPSRLIGAALAAHPGSATRIDMSGAANRPATVYIKPAVGDPRQVMVDPGTGRVLGSFVYRHTIVGFADTMHGSLTLGWIGDAIVELAACWALVLIGTGLFLWWPRGKRSLAGAFWPRLTARGRLFWRDLHAVTGLWATALIVFLIATGLPWAGVQGPVTRGALTALGIGNQADGFGAQPLSSKPAGPALGRIPWSQGQLAMPASDPAHAGHGGGGEPGADRAAVRGADAIVTQGATLGIRDFRLYLPSDPTGVFTLMTYPDQPQGQRTLTFDRWSYRIIGENGWSDYGLGAKAIELGVMIHMGRYFGIANQLLMLIPCLAIITLVVSGTIMWWRRRPSGSLGAPPAIGGARLRGALSLLVVAAVAMPLFGASLVVLAILDRLAVATRRPACA